MTTALVTRNHEIALAGPVGSLDAYIQAVGSVPVLSKEDEQALAIRFREEDDLDAARELVLAHLRGERSAEFSQQVTRPLTLKED